MINQEFIIYLMRIVALFLAYLPTIAVAGCFRAWVAKKMGDDTAEHQGLLTLDPFAHLDLFGTISLLIAGIGWGRNVVINPFNIQGKWRPWKLFFAYYSDILAHLALAFLGLILLLSGKLWLTNHGYIAFAQSTIRQALELVVAGLFSINLFLLVFSLIFNTVSLFLVYLNEQEEFEFNEYIYYASLLVPLLILFLFGDDLRRLFSVALINLYFYLV